MRYDNIPSGERVAATLDEMGGHSTARQLCDNLVRQGYPRPDTQLGIQRTAERGGIEIGHDWTLTAPAAPAMAP